MNTFRVVLLASMATVVAACSSTPSKPAAAPAPAAAAAAPKAAAPAVLNIAGNWTLVTESQMGPLESKLTVEQSGKNIKGKYESQMGSVDYTGTVEGNDVKFWFNFNAQGTDLRIDYIGTVENGNAIKGKAVFGSFGEGTFTGKKAP